MAGDQFVASYESVPNTTNPSWWKDACLRKHALHILGLMLCPFYLGYDQSLLNGLQSLPYWTKYYHSPSGDWLGLISTAIFLPGVVGGFPTAWFCNTYGRKWSIIIGSVLIIIGGIWNGLNTSTNQLIGSRVLVGCGGVVAKTAAPVYLQEIAHPRLRVRVSTMYYGFYYVGSLLSAIMCIIGLQIHNDWSWRLPSLFQILGPTIVIACCLTAPESPRFLMKKCRDEEALDVLATHHANGDKDDPLVHWEIAEIRSALAQEVLESKSRYVDFLKTPGNRKRLVVSVVMAWGINWVGNGIVSYYLTPVLKSVGVKSPTKLVSINAGLALWNLIIAETAGINAHRFGRRTLFLVSTIGMIISYCFVMGFSAGFAQTKSSALGLAAIPFLFLFYGSYDIGWTTLNFSYCAEIMPYDLRAKGMAIYICVQQFGNAFNQFVNPIALEKITWKYYSVYIVVDIGYAILIYFFFPETKGLTIEEVGLVFDYGTKNGRKMAKATFEERLTNEHLKQDPADLDKPIGTQHVEVTSKV